MPSKEYTVHAETRQCAQGNRAKINSVHSVVKGFEVIALTMRAKNLLYADYSMQT